MQAWVCSDGSAKPDGSSNKSEVPWRFVVDSHFFFVPLFLPPFWPPFFAGALFCGFPLPEPLFLPPPEALFTVAQARFSASFFETPRAS